MESFYPIIIMTLIVLFFISFALFIRRLLINSSVKAKNLSHLEKKVDRLIEQNDQLFSLLKEKNH